MYLGIRSLLVKPAKLQIIMKNINIRIFVIFHSKVNLNSQVCININFEYIVAIKILQFPNFLNKKEIYIIKLFMKN